MSRTFKTLRSSTKNKFASLRLHGPDQKGIVAACSHALDKFGCGIVQSETWTDRIEHLFFQRILFDYEYEQQPGSPYSNKKTFNTNINMNLRHDGDDNENGNNIIIQPDRKLAIDNEIMQIQERFGLDSMKINWRDQPKKVAVFVSKWDHCLVSYLVNWAISHFKFTFYILSFTFNISNVLKKYKWFKFQSSHYFLLLLK
jgi:formyltetrahydrofolate hydrolase